MRSYIELFDLRSGNVVANYATEDEAWDALRQAATKFGLEEIEELALSQSHNGQDTLIAMDDDLVRRVAGELHPADGDRVKTDDKTIERVAS